MKDKNYHTCRRKDKSAIIYKWEKADFRKDLVGKWTLDVFGVGSSDSNCRVFIVVRYCPYCGILLG